MSIGSRRHRLFRHPSIDRGPLTGPPTAQSRWACAAAGFLLAILMVSLADIRPAWAYLAPTSVTGRTAAGATFVLPNAFNVPLAIAGTNLTSDITFTNFNSVGGPAAGFYSPSFPIASPAIGGTANLGGCPAATATRQTCANRGTITLSFPQPVRNPRLHLGGMGGNVILDAATRTNLSARFTIASAANGATPVAATWTQLAGNGNLGNTTTTAFSTVLAGNTSCSVTPNPAACGTLQVNGTITQLVLNVGVDYSGNLAFDVTTADAFMTLVTIDEDFGDAAASYDPTQAAVHNLSDLVIGTTVTADNTAVQASTTSPNASAAANLDSDDFVWPTLVRNTTTALVVPIANASKSGTLCGWVDFNNGGTFAAAEGICQAFAIGATSVTLNIPTPAAAVVGSRVARLRVDYGTELTTATPAGRADSGEVEDALVTIASLPTINLRKTTLGALGSFGFALTNTLQTTGAVATTALNTPTQVDGDTVTPGVQVFTVATAGQAVTIDENSLPAGWTLSAAVCTDAGNATVGSLSGTTYTIPASATALDAVLTCTFTNTRQPILRLQKALPLGRFVATDQFALTISGPGGPSTVTTTGSSNAPGEVAIVNPGSSGGVYTLTEAGAAGTNLPSYTTTYACTNALAGGQTPGGSGVSFNVTAADGDDLTCTFSNTRAPIADLSITKTNTPGVNGDIDQAGDTLARGATTTYTIVVSNTGPDAVTGAVLRDPAAGRSNLTCTAPATCTGAACPSATLSLAALDAGVVLGNLVNGGTVTVTLSCVVN